MLKKILINTKVNIKAKKSSVQYNLVTEEDFVMNKNKSGSKIWSWVIFSVMMFVIVIIGISVFTVKSGDGDIIEQKTTVVQKKETMGRDRAEKIIREYADKNGIDFNDYPASIIDLLARNSETEDFVLSYPKEKDKSHKINMKEYKNCKEVPLFMQWDKRWGYMEYGSDVAGLTACGPVCLSMAAVYVKQDIKYSPDYVIEFAIDNGYCLENGGSEWVLISEGGEKLGMDVTEIPLDKNRVFKNLEAGNPIICVMGPGDFTAKGHFIVMVGCEDGKIKVNDPNSKSNSEKLWNYDDIYSQIKNLWVLR